MQDCFCFGSQRRVVERINVKRWYLPHCCTLGGVGQVACLMLLLRAQDCCFHSYRTELTCPQVSGSRAGLSTTLHATTSHRTKGTLHCQYTGSSGECIREEQLLAKVLAPVPGSSWPQRGVLHVLCFYTLFIHQAAAWMSLNYCAGQFHMQMWASEM